MPLTTYTPQQIVTNTTQVIQQYTTRVRNFGSGTIGGALIHAVKFNVLFLQGLASYIAGITRASGSAGADLTSFFADYGLNPPRVLATYATENIVLGKYAPSTAQGVVLVGTILQNAVLPPLLPSQAQVVADPTNGAYDATLGGGIGGYYYAAGTTALTVLAQSLTLGSAGNWTAGTLSQIASPGVPADFVTQASNFSNGLDQESDPALRVRGGNFLASLGGGGNYGKLAAVTAGVQNGLTFQINDGKNASGATQAAHFCVVVDDGSGAIPATTLAAVTAAIDAARAQGIGRDVIAPTNTTLSVAVTGTTVYPGFNASSVRTALQTAIIAFINGNGVGGYNPQTGIASGKLSYVALATLVNGFVGTGTNQGLQPGYALSLQGGSVDVAIDSYHLARTDASHVSVS